jgi:type II secretory pathway pseudopilin PulG
VVIGIIAILAGVALGPITNGIKQAKHNTAMQTTRQIGTILFSSATDNNGVYPFSTTSTLVAKSLITGGYATDPNLFLVSDQIGKNGVTGPGTVTVAAGVTTVTMTNANMSYNFVVGATTAAGVTSNASDLLPLVYFSGGTAVTYTGTGSKDLTLSQANCPFGIDGVAVFYKGNNAVYMKAGTVTSGVVTKFVSANYADSNTYTEIQP